jgi:hypothetical protein
MDAGCRMPDAGFFRRKFSESGNIEKFVNLVTHPDV